MNPLWLAAGLILLGILLSAIFSGAETGAYQLNRTRHRLALAEGLAGARVLQVLTADMTAFVVVCLVGTNLANTLVSYAATLALEVLGWGPAELLATLLIGPILFVGGELAPKEFFRRRPALLYPIARFLQASSWLLRPVVGALGLLTGFLRVLGLRTEDGRELGAEERVRQAIAHGAESGTLSQYQTVLARNIFSLGKRRVRHAMVPMAQVDYLEAETELEAARAFVQQSGHSRYLVTEGGRARVVGLVNLYDLLFESRPGSTVRSYAEEVLELAPGELVATALVRMRRNQAHMAVVTVKGRALGLITLKDLVEEITGELQDL